MGEMLLKQRTGPGGVRHWQSMEMLTRKPWPPVVHQRNTHPRPSFAFRPPEATYAYPGCTPNQIYQNGKKRDHYFLAPYYRNAMPPPPPNSSRLLMVDPRRRANSRKPEFAPCRCRSRSMEDVRTVVVEVDDEWSGNVNGGRKVPNGKANNRRSMENLLGEPRYCSPSKRIISYQVWFHDRLISCTDQNSLSSRDVLSSTYGGDTIF